MTTLVTGGAGFIGSHMVACLMRNKIDFVVVDNLSNSDLRNINSLINHFDRNINFEKIDIRNVKNMKRVFVDYKIDSIIHFASLKSVNDSINKPALYEDNNVIGSKVVISLAKEFNIKKFIFSSSACVYGEPEYLPIDEKHPLNPSNPYGQNKVDIELMLLKDSYFSLSCATSILRYFNPIGCLSEEVIGELPINKPQNLMPFLISVANDKFSVLEVFGDDYDTHDGTPIRDYIHVEDLINAHYLALNESKFCCEIYNVGSSSGYSVLDIISAFEHANGISIPYRIQPRRDGDVSICYANCKKIKKKLGWTALHSIEKMCADSYNFSQRNINKP